MVSFEFRNYPGASLRCDVCKRDDCSKGDQLWLHMLTIETDGGYRPVIGHNCLHHILENSTLKPKPLVHEVVRDPSDEEIGAYIRKHFTIVPRPPIGMAVETEHGLLPGSIIEVSEDDHHADHQHGNESDPVVDDGSQHDPAQKRARRTVRQDSGQKPRGVRGK